jgi:hypothetical protein
MTTNPYVIGILTGMLFWPLAICLTLLASMAGII